MNYKKVISGKQLPKMVLISGFSQQFRHYHHVSLKLASGNDTVTYLLNRP